jgi:hypothetical protein
MLNIERVLPLCVIAASLYAQGKPTDVLVATSSVVRSDANGAIRLPLKNISSQSITAYAVRWTVDSFSMVSGREFFSSLGMESLAPDKKFGVNGLPPDGMDLARNNFVDFPNRDIGVQVIAVIFADRTAVGDPTQITEYFERRRAQTEILGRWVQEVSKLDRSDAQRFFGAVANLMPAAKDDDSRWIHELGLLHSTQPEQGPLMPDTFVRILQTRYAAAQDHSTRRTI